MEQSFLKKRFSTEGRATRRELFFAYFIFCLFMAGTFALVYVGEITLVYLMNIPFPFILVYIWRVHIRRMHDLGKSNSYAVILLIPFFNFIFVYYLLIAGGNIGPNSYGPDPRGYE
ncbi:DUF805 domain-containing protein [Candidatus Uabimicrobium sp. HlEnr_7]|uniref:DUF805 domain-containing protein n=1 Tax=Candidatus Uabimicrobium helgolandensis TaxID=3095367 RepID=UPI0035563491